MTESLILAALVACAAWTVTNEEVFAEPREFCIGRSKSCRNIWQRKFFYLFTCEYCFSHWVAALTVWVSGFHLLYANFFGAIIGWFAIIAIANVYMSLFRLVRVSIKLIGAKAKREEQALELNRQRGFREGYDL